jgi:Ca2+-transporting ATPase
MTDEHQLETTEILRKLDSDWLLGLTHSEASRRFKKYGPNQIQEQQSKSPWLILWEQLVAPLVLLLLGAVLISLGLGDYKEGIVILLIVLINAVLGFTQEYRAEKAMEKLKNLAIPKVRVLREGYWQEITAPNLVVGDIVQLLAGNLIPADIRLLEVANLRINESILTGEAEPVNKNSSRLVGEFPLSDRYNMSYMGTLVSYGRGKGIVTATGMNTELGKIATLLQTVDSQLTPLQKQLQKLGQDLLIAAIALVLVIFLLGIWQGEPIKQMFLTGVSMAVAAVPESLPAVVTIALALGSQRMLKRGALIRKLPAVETLGSVTVICSDKTGTLTENRMTVNVLDVVGRRLNLTSYLSPNSPWLDSRIVWQWHHNLGAMPYITFTKGAVDRLLDICTEVWVNDQAEPLTGVWKEKKHQIWLCWMIILLPSSLL